MSTEAIECGMFLYEGFRDYVEKNGTPPLLFGAVEQAQAMARIAEFIADETDRWLEFAGETGDRPGVLQYDVWNPMGWAVARAMSVHGTEFAERLWDGHEQEWLRSKLHALLHGFFAGRGTR